VFLREINKDRKKTFVLVTHDPNVAQSTDRLILIRDGKIEGEKRF
jgi:ABC-type lipoprotein export system ATPase subunit